MMDLIDGRHSQNEKLQESPFENIRVDAFREIPKVLFTVALQRLFALQIRGLVHSFCKLKGEIVELGFHRAGYVWIASVANKHFQSQFLQPG